MKKIPPFIGALLAVFCLATAAFPSSEHYSRIVSLAPSVTEILFAMDLGDSVVGVTSFCDHPEEAKEKPKVGGFTDHSIEAILQQKPDLVVLSPNRGTKFIYEELIQMKVNTLVVPLYGLDDLLKSFEAIGEKTGHEEIAADIRLEFEKTISEVKIAAENREPRTAVLVNWQTPLIIAGEGSLENDIMNLAGGKNIAAGSPTRYPKWSIEALYGADPDIIIDASNHGRWDNMEERRKIARKYWVEHPHLRAVKDGNIFLFKKNVYSVPGPRTLALIKGVNEIFDSGNEKEGQYFERLQL